MGTATVCNMNGIQFFPFLYAAFLCVFGISFLCAAFLGMFNGLRNLMESDFFSFLYAAFNEPRNHTEADFVPFLYPAFLCAFGIPILYAAFFLMGSQAIWNPILFPFYMLQLSSWAMQYATIRKPILVPFYVLLLCACFGSRLCMLHLS